MPRVLRIGTRGSALALVQARWVQARLAERGAIAELVTIRTAGDDRAPETAWGEGAFVTAIERSLIEGRIDVAVHSAKDLPTSEDPRLVVAAFPSREDPRDALVCRVRGTSLSTLPSGARVGTDSPRRTAFLHERRPDLRMHPLSGNVDTRLAKLDAGETDALVLAVAGLTRLDRADRIDEILAPGRAAPAPGQGCLAIQVRADDRRAIEAIAPLDDPDTRAAVEAERAFLAATGGGCRSPIGALARVEAGSVVLEVAAARDAGSGAGPWLAPAPGAGRPSAIIRLAGRGPVEDRMALARDLARRIVALRTRPRVLVTRPAEQAAPLVEALGSAGMEATVVPTIVIEAADAAGRLGSALADAAAAAAAVRVVVTSSNGARAVLEAARLAGVEAATLRWVAVGEATARVLTAAGARDVFRPARASGAGIAAELRISPGDRLLLARGDLADGTLPAALRGRGASVDEIVAYRTAPAPAGSRPTLLAALNEGPVDAIVCTSPSSVHGLVALAPADRLRSLQETIMVCIGPTTASAAREAGFTAVAEAPAPRPSELAATVADALGLESRPPARSAGPTEPSTVVTGGPR